MARLQDTTVYGDLLIPGVATLSPGVGASFTDRVNVSDVLATDSGFIVSHPDQGVEQERYKLHYASSAVDSFKDGVWGLRLEHVPSSTTIYNADYTAEEFQFQYDLTVGGNVLVDNHGFGGTPTIALAVGDSDTGLHSDSDGQLEVWTNNAERIHIDNGTTNVLNTLRRNGNTVWDAGNDGAGSGLDADLLDGQHASAFADAGHSHSHGSLTGVGASDHHAKYTDEEAQDAVGLNVGNALSYNDTSGAISVTESAISHDNLAGVSASDHHAKYTNAEAVAAVNAETTLTVDIAGDADTLDGLHADDITGGAARNLADLSSTDTTTNINQASLTPIPWDTERHLDTGYTHSTATNPSRVTFDEAGTYLVEVQLAFEGSSGGQGVVTEAVKTAQPSARFRLNGSTLLEGRGLTSWVESNTGDFQGSVTFSRHVTASANDYLEVVTEGLDDLTTVTLRSGESTLLLTQLSQVTALTGDADTVDGFHAAELGTDVSDDGSPVLQNATDLNFGANLAVTDDGDGTATIAGSAAYGDEQAQDAVGNAVGSGLAYDDPSGAISVAQGPGSGLDADTVDGVGADGFVSTSGDTMTGSLYIQNANPEFRLFETDGSDPDDYGNVVFAGGELRARVRDDSAGTTIDGFRVNLDGRLRVADTIETLSGDPVYHGGSEAAGFTLENRTSDPAGASVGQVWFRTDV